MSFNEVGQLRSELGELCLRLHESLERENAAVESVETAKGQVKSLKEEVERLEVEALERSTVEQEYVQAKLELEVARAVEQERYKWQETETKLLYEIAGIKKQLSESSKMNIAQSVCASQGGDSNVYKYISNVGCHAGTVITTTGYSSSTACSPPHVGLVNNSVSGMSVNTTVEGVTTPIPHASQYNSSTVANADSNMSVAGGLAASSLPIIYPLQNNIYSPVPMLNQLPPNT